MKQQKQVEETKGSAPRIKNNPIHKHKNFWIYVDDEMLLASSQKSDKEFMKRKVKQYVR